MSRGRKRKQRSTSVTIERRDPLSGNLIARADTTALLYGTMKKVAKPDEDGIQRAIVTIDGSEIHIDAPNPAELHRLCTLYGVEPASVASETEPCPLIPKYEEESNYMRDDPQARSALRHYLGMIVDDV